MAGTPQKTATYGPKDFIHPIRGFDMMSCLIRSKFLSVQAQHYAQRTFFSQVITLTIFHPLNWKPSYKMKRVEVILLGFIPYIMLQINYLFRN